KKNWSPGVLLASMLLKADSKRRFRHMRISHVFGASQFVTQSEANRAEVTRDRRRYNLRPPLLFGMKSAHSGETGKESWSGEFDCVFLDSCLSPLRFRRSRPIPTTLSRFEACTYSAAFRCLSRCLATNSASKRLLFASPSVTTESSIWERSST